MTDSVRGSKASYFLSLDLSKAFNRITDSGIAWDFQRSLCPAPLLKQGHLEPAAQDCVPTARQLLNISEDAP